MGPQRRDGSPSPKSSKQKKPAARRKKDTPPTAQELKKEKQEYLDSLWNKPRRLGTYGSSDADMMDNFKAVSGREYDRFRSLRRAGLSTLSLQDPKEQIGLAKAASVNMLRDLPGHTSWEGSIRLMRGDFMGAIERCNEALTQGDDCPGVPRLRALRDRVTAKISTCDYRGALADLANIPHDARTFGDWLGSGEARLNLKDYVGAIEDLDRAISMDAKRPLAWKHRALARFRAKDYEEAITDSDEALTFTPSDPDLHLVLARSKYELNDMAGCLAHFEIAIKHDGSDAALWFERAEARIATGDEEGAVRDLAKALQIDSTSIECWRHKARIMMKKKDWRQAMRDSTRVILLDPTIAEAWVIRGESKVMMRDMEGAMPDLEEAARLDPTCALPSYYLAKGKFQKGLYVESMDLCGEALQADPKHRATKKLLAKCEEQEERLRQVTFAYYRPTTPRRKGQEHLLESVAWARTLPERRTWKSDAARATFS